MCCLLPVKFQRTTPGMSPETWKWSTDLGGGEENREGVCGGVQVFWSRVDRFPQRGEVWGGDTFCFRRIGLLKEEDWGWGEICGEA